MFYTVTFHESVWPRLQAIFRYWGKWYDGEMLANGMVKAVLFIPSKHVRRADNTLCHLVDSLQVETYH